MKCLKSGFLVFMFFVGLSSTAAALEVQAASVATVSSDLSALETASYRQDKFGGMNIIWALGGGLIAVSLVARRTTS